MSFERRLKVVVVDDDFMIARVHAKYIDADAQAHYQVVGTAHNGVQALEVVKQSKPHLLLLDVYLPDRSGIDVLEQIRVQKIPCDVILITASKELEIVEQGFRLGIFDYLVKPFSLQRLSESLQKYSQYKWHLDRSDSISQETVDHLKQFRSTAATNRQTSESGIDQRTLDRVRQTLLHIGRACTAEEVAERSGVSRSTARNYLGFLVKTNVAYEELSYGSIGRPRRLFNILR